MPLHHNADTSRGSAQSPALLTQWRVKQGRTSCTASTASSTAASCCCCCRGPGVGHIQQVYRQQCLNRGELVQHVHALQRHTHPAGEMDRKGGGCGGCGECTVEAGLMRVSQMNNQLTEPLSTLQITRQLYTSDPKLTQQGMWVGPAAHIKHWCCTTSSTHLSPCATQCPPTSFGPHPPQ